MAQMISVKLGASETTRTMSLVAAGATAGNTSATSRRPAQRQGVFVSSFNKSSA